MTSRDIQRPLQIRRKLNLNKPINQDLILRFDADNHSSSGIDKSRREGDSTELEGGWSESDSGRVGRYILTYDEEERISCDGWIGIGYILA